MSSKTVLILVTLLLATPTTTFAHEGGHSEEKSSSASTEEVVPLNDSIYAVNDRAVNDVEEVESSIPGDDPMGSPFSSTEILGRTDPLGDMKMTGGEPMARHQEEKDGEKKQGSHEMHKRHVEKATHEWVSHHAKGYGVAVGITIISALAFAGLSFLRIGEGSSRDPS